MKKHSSTQLMCFTLFSTSPCNDPLLQIEHLTNELARMRENLKSEKSEVYKWKDLVKELRSLLDGKNDEIERKRDEASVPFLSYKAPRVFCDCEN